MTSLGGELVGGEIAWWLGDRHSLRRVRASRVELEFGVLVFVEGGKPENPEKNPRSKDKNQQQTQPTYGTRPESNPGHIGGRRALYK